MAKRFTDTAKWKRPWYRALNVHAKVVWQYLCDECDHAGVWLADFELLSFQVGFKVDEIKLKEWLGDKLVRIDGDKFFIPSFFEFQYGSSDSMFKAKISALKRLGEFNLLEDTGALKDLSNSYLSLSELSMDALSIGTGKGKGKGTGGSGGKSTDAPSGDEYEAVYQLYPKKIGKSDGLTKLRRLCPTKPQLAQFEKAMLAYVEKCRVNDTFLKQFDTFVNSSWQDCLASDYGDTKAGTSGVDAEIIANWEKRDGVSQ